MVTTANGATASSGAQTSADTTHRESASFWTLTLGCVGVVYGDIGTSPLYAFREAVKVAAGSGPLTREIILGVLSMILWSLIIVVTLKYVVLLLRMDNNGEGGTLSLTALAFRAVGRRAPYVLMLGIIGAAMFYGSSLITPALSVLSAVEGLKIRTPALEPYVLPITLTLLIALFAMQSRGTGKVAVLFGPIMVFWFVVVGLLGGLHIADDPGVLAAINPYYAVAFMFEHGSLGLIMLGAVFLAVTGSEALYADLGHFGRKPIQTAWFYLVFPALLLSYFGQGALVLSNPQTIENPFFLLAPDPLLIPLVVLATVATVIASQAVITGAYSITHQAIQLGLLPRLEIRHTSAALYGQIYIPRVNFLLLIGVLLLVGLFRTASDLAAAYVLAVAATSMMATFLAFIVVWKMWNWQLWSTALLMTPFVVTDGAYLFAALTKLGEGAWLPVAFGALVVLMMTTWRRGTGILMQKTRRTEVPLESLVHSLEKKPPHLVPGTAVFLTSDPEFAPTALLHNLKHNKVLHEHNVVLTIIFADTPRVPESERVAITPISDRFQRVALKFGFMEQPNVPKALAIARKLGWTFDIMSTSFFLSRRAIKKAAHSGMPQWQDRLFIGLAKSATDASDFFQIPTGRVMEVGTQVTV